MSLRVYDCGLQACFVLPPTRDCDLVGLECCSGVFIFMKSSHGDSDKSTGLKIIYLVSNRAIINCPRDASLRIIFGRFFMRE